MQGLMMDYPLTLDRILVHANQLHPTKRISTKLPDGSFHRYTYADLYQRVKRLANVLEGLGVEPGDRVGTFSWNNYQHMELYFGVPCCGAVCHTLNIRLSAEQLVFIVNHAEDKVIFVDGTLLKLMEPMAEQIDCVEHIVVFNAEQGTETSLPNVSFYEELMSAADDDHPLAVADENQAMGLCYTSGTTGEPKGALYSHRSMYLHTVGSNQGNALALTESDVVLPVVPQFHAMAWGLPYSATMAGAELVMPGPFLQAEALAEMIAEERVTVPAGVPTIWMGLAQELKANPRDLSTVRDLLVGGSAMPRALTEVYEKELGVRVLHAWGMTELSPLGTICNLKSAHSDLSDDEKLDIKAKQGFPVAGVEIRIVDDEGNELPWDGETMGELQVRGPWVSRSYFRKEPDLDNFASDGWFRTGDVVTVTPDGYMEITDRTKDLVKSGGEWISSVALENSLMAHPGVLEAAVIAIPDKRWDERPLAVVVCAPDSEPVSEEDLKEHLAPHFAKYWVPDQILFGEEIPKTSVGKFDKKVLRQLFTEGKLV